MENGHKGWKVKFSALSVRLRLRFTPGTKRTRFRFYLPFSEAAALYLLLFSLCLFPFPLCFFFLYLSFCFFTGLSDTRDTPVGRSTDLLLAGKEFDFRVRPTRMSPRLLRFCVLIRRILGRVLPPPPHLTRSCLSYPHKNSSLGRAVELPRGTFWLGSFLCLLHFHVGRFRGTQMYASPRGIS